MKKIIVIALIITSILIIAFYASLIIFYVSWVYGDDLPTLSPTDRSCTTNADCISTCSCGCINKNENCKSDEYTDCARHAYESFNCQCVNNVCQNVDGRNVSNEPVDDIDVSNLQNEEIIDVRCWKCVDCGCDVHILRTDEKISHASYDKTYECLDSLAKVDGEYYQYKMKKDQFLSLHACLNQGKNRVSVGCIECEGCGCDVNAKNKFLGNSDFHVVFSCLSKYPQVPKNIDDIYLLSDKEIDDVKKCLKTGKIVYNSASDIYNNFTKYQDKYVEFEGYVIQAYECPPCPDGMVCEACLDPYLQSTKNH